MKNILLPTDLTVQSLRPIHDIVKDARGQQLTISVVHLISLPTSITDLLFINESKPNGSVPENFTEAFQLLCNKYHGSTTRLVFDFIYCNSSRYFNNYIAGSDINAVYVLSGYGYSQPLKQSQNILPFLTHCKVPIKRIETGAEVVSEYQNFSALLNDREAVATATRKSNTSITFS